MTDSRDTTEDLAEALPADAFDDATAPDVFDADAGADSDGEAVADWRDDLPEDLRSSRTFDKFGDLGSFARSYRDLERTLSGEKVPVPRSDEDWDRWFDAAGRPECPEDYELEAPEVPDGMDYSDELDERFRDLAYSHGLNQDQAQGLRSEMLDFLSEQHAREGEMREEARRLGEADLKREWGHAWQERLGEASTAMRRFAGEDFAAWAEETGAGNDPRLIKAFANIARATLGEDALTGRDGGLGAPGDIDAAIAGFRGAHEAALFDRLHPEHETRVAELRRLYEMRHPGE